MPQSQMTSVIAAACTGIALGLAAYLLYRVASRGDESFKDKKKKYVYRDKKTVKTGDNITTDHREDKNSVPGTTDDGSATRSDVVTTDGFTVLKLDVPSEYVGAIIGRQGCNIKQIQADTKTKIDFNKNDDGPERTLTIRGSEKGTQDAELKILHIVYGQKTKETFTMEVPKGCLGYIIGKGGETVRKIQSDSHCQVKVNSADGDRSDPKAMAMVKLTGTDNEIQAAATMVKEQVDAWQEKKLKMEMVKENNRSRQHCSRRGPLPYEVSVISKGSPLQCEVWPDTRDYLDCYVTAIVNPTHIWLQVLSQNSTKLDEINTRLCNLYSDSSQIVDDVVSNRPPIGTTVAARNLTENLWYRGKISAYSDENEPAVDIYYVDYGDSGWLPLENCNLQLLRPDFYSLRAQAIECYTDMVLLPGCPETFTDEQCDTFERLTHTGSWKRVVGAAVGWKAREDGVELPVVKLVDTNTEVDIVIRDEMMKAMQTDKVKENVNSAHIQDLSDSNQATFSVPSSFGQQANHISSETKDPDIRVDESQFSCISESVIEDRFSKEDDWD
ncbi:tudor and KH domain-containing protein-like [Watersipora subatra]|uniref:tudor and KH domain-containing protein-like n=1 Tax=Watersipora subatra TaxID=2589382 RepID=UPI00355B0424